MTLPKLLLLVEDDEGLAELFQQALVETRMPIIWVRTGKEALSHIQKTPESLLLLDYSLPDMTANELVETLRSAGFTPSFIVITGHGGESVAVNMMRLGALDYLIKDTQLLDRLPQAVDRILKEFKMRKELEDLERQRRENASELTAVYEHSPTALLVLDMNLRIKNANPASIRLISNNTKLLNQHVGEALGCVNCGNPTTVCGQTGHCTDCPLKNTLFDTLRNNHPHSQVEVEIHRPNHHSPSITYFLVSTAPLLLKETPAVLVCLEDITERKQNEAALKASEERFRRAILEAPIPMMIFDEHGRVLQISKGWTRFSGYTLEEIPTLQKWLEKSLGADPEIIQQHQKTLLTVQQITPPFEWQIKAKDEKKRTWDIQTTPLGQPESSSRLLLTMAVDITERKQTEMQLLRSQRMESVGRLASGIAHDLNNVLAPILMVLPILRDAVADEETRHLVDTIESSAQRGAGIVKQVLTFGRGLEVRQGPLQMRHLIKEMGQIICETFPKSITLEIRCSTNLWTILGDFTQIHQVLMNLSLNARDAMPAGGKIVLAAENIRLPKSFSGTVGLIAPGPSVLLTVQDSGTGISPENIEKIFDPFFTTKEIGKGTGLGLATVAGIVKAHNGAINVSSTPGKGTTFQIYFPASPDVLSSFQTEKVISLPSGHGETILVVDDEESFCEITRKILGQNGYQVLCASNGVLAMEVFQKHSSSIKLVLADYMMPRMDGFSLALAIHEISPKTKVVLSTGFNENIDENRFQELKSAGLTNRLAKPFTVQELLLTVDRVLQNS